MNWWRFNAAEGTVNIVPRSPRSRLRLPEKVRGAHKKQSLRHIFLVLNSANLDWARRIGTVLLGC